MFGDLPRFNDGLSVKRTVKQVFEWRSESLETFSLMIFVTSKKSVRNTNVLKLL